VSWVFPDELPELPELAELDELPPHAASSGAAAPAAAAAAPPCNSLRRLNADSDELAFFGLSIVVLLLSEVRSHVGSEYIPWFATCLFNDWAPVNWCFFA
jgi:hypothetical protein